MEQTLGGGHGHEVRALAAAAGLASDCHAVRVAAKLGDVVAHPFQGKHQVHQAHVAGACQACSTEPGEVAEPKHPEPMTDRDHHHVGQPGEMLALESLEISGARGVTASVNDEHDRALAVVSNGRRPDVDDEAVFTHAAAVVVPANVGAVVAGVGAGMLRCDVAPVGAIAHA